MAERWRVYLQVFEGPSEDACMKYIENYADMKGVSISDLLDSGRLMKSGKVLDTPTSTG